MSSAVRGGCEQVQRGRSQGTTYLAIMSLFLSRILCVIVIMMMMMCSSSYNHTVCLSAHEETRTGRLIVVLVAAY